MTTLPLRVTVAPERAEAAPGDALTFEVTVRNASDIVEHYEVGFVGLPDGATVRTEPAVAKLRPGESATVTARISLPVQPPAPAGTYVTGALVRSRYRQEVSRCVEVPVLLAPVEQVTVRATPEVVTGGRAGWYTIEVANGGNSPVRLHLAATDPERLVAVTFDPPSVDLPPGTSARSLLTVRAQPPWNRERQRQLTITATPDQPGAAPGTGTASFVQKPRFASKFAKAAGIGAAVLVLAAAIAVPALMSRAGDARTADVAPTAPAPAGAPSGGPPPVASSAPGAPAQPSGAAPSGPAPSGAPSPDASEPTRPPAAGPRVVDLTAPADGTIGSDTFRNEGFLVSADPGTIAVPGCENANAVAVFTDPAGKRFLTSANPDDPATCHTVPVMIDFLRETPAGEVRLTPLAKGTLEMEVGYADLSRTTEPSLAVSAEKARARGGVDFVLVRPKPGADAANTPVALTALRVAPLG